jgi:hypothetical protein
MLRKCHLLVYLFVTFILTVHHILNCILSFLLAELAPGTSIWETGFDLFVYDVYLWWGLLIDKYFGFNEFYAFVLKYLGVDVEILEKETK